MEKKNMNKKAEAKITKEEILNYQNINVNRYNGYFYRQINKLWNSVKHLEQENLKLKTLIKGSD